MSQPQPTTTWQQDQAMREAVADGMRRGWQLEAEGPGWARMGKYEPVNHGGLFVLSVLTAGIGLFFWAYAANRGPTWERTLIAADASGQVQMARLDKNGQPRRYN